MSKRLLPIAALVAVFSGSAWAFPWDIDLVDAYFWRAYEWVMMPLPEGVISTNYVTNATRGTPEGEALRNPLEANAKTVAAGQEMFNIYCQTCHGVEGQGGAEVTRNDPAKGLRRYPIPPPKLSGNGSRLSTLSDGFIYLTVRNGGGVMPSYGAAMDEHEMWSVVAYLRSLNGGASQNPAQ